jgi:hypothetical protein
LLGLAWLGLAWLASWVGREFWVGRFFGVSVLGAWVVINGFGWLAS